MLDNLRDQSSFQEEEDALETNTPKPPSQRHGFDRITGTSARQRFALAVMLSIMVCLVGTMLLVISGKMVPEFLF